MRPAYVSSPGSHAVGLVTDGTWGELTMTWNTKLPPGTPLATWIPQAGTPSVLSVLGAVQQRLGVDGAISFRLFATNSTSDRLVYYASREAAAAVAPRLILTSTNAPALSATQIFWVTVLAPAQPALSAATFRAGQFRWTVSGDAGPDYTVEVSTNLVSWGALFTTNSPALPFSWAEASTYAQRFHRVRLGP